MLRKLLFAIGYIILFAPFLRAQTTSDFKFLKHNNNSFKVFQRTDTNGTHSYAYDSDQVIVENIGRKVHESDTLIFRSYFEFDTAPISQFSGSNVTITDVELYYVMVNNNDEDFDFKLTEIDAINGTESQKAKADWEEIGTGNNIYTGITYADENTVDIDDLVSSVQQAVDNDEPVIFGVLSQSEADSASVDTFNPIELKVTFTRQAYNVHLSANNAFDNEFSLQDSGMVGVGINQPPQSHDAPYHFMANETDTVHLKAYDHQQLGNYEWVFNDTEAEQNSSRWNEKTGEDIKLISNSATPTYNPDLDHDFADLIANLKRLYDVDLTYNTEWDSWTDYKFTQVVKNTSKQLEAPATKHHNGYPLNFSGWQDDFYAPRNRTISPTDHTTYTALYKGHQLSDDPAAYSGSSQRRLIQTEAGGDTWLHQVYTSMGHVWIEHSGDGGNTWTLGNGGRPLFLNYAIVHIF